MSAWRPPAASFGQSPLGTVRPAWQPPGAGYQAVPNAAWAPRWAPPSGQPWGAPPVAAPGQLWAPPTGQPAGYPTGYPTPWAPPPSAKPKSSRAVILVFLAALVFLGPTILGALNQAFETPIKPVPQPPPTQPNLPTGPSDPTTVPAPTGLPSLPQPRTQQEQEMYLYDNPLYDQSIADSVDCSLGQIDLPSASRSEVEAYMNNFVSCLMETWSEPLSRAGFVMPQPYVTVYTESIKTKCGKLPMENAVYCSADQQIYYALDLTQALPNTLQDSRFMAESIIAHEFGHAVQARTGILVSEMLIEEDASDEAEANQWSRRTELQADCFAGLFLRAVAQSTQMTETEDAAIRRLFWSLGDSQPGSDHGSSANRESWVSAGLGSNTPGSCRTFTASADAVE
ncbi:MAG: neutral zinc metallopeptidase [Propionibacteriaceae bacterium]|nr:neutral zinc metallopeptidase [Propionibacteriaceae bacterium]